MIRMREFAILITLVCAISFARAGAVVGTEPFLPIVPPSPSAPDEITLDDPLSELTPSTDTNDNSELESTAFFHSLSKGFAQNDQSVAPPLESAKFPKAIQIPNTEVWWKFGGFIKGDMIHDFQPAGTADRFVPITIPTNGQEGQNTLFQAKVTRLNLDVRMPSEWGIARGFVETDFFTSDNTLRIRHAYTEVGSLLVGQTWSGFTDPDSIPRTLDFESPIAFITTRQGQIRWTQDIGENLKWAMSMENPTTTVDDVVLATIPGQPQQPIPDFVTRLKYKTETVEWFAAALFRELTYRPDVGSVENRFGWATNLVGIVRPTKTDKIMGQVIFGNGLGRYRSGSDLGLASPTTVEPVSYLGGCFGLTHDWTKKLSSNAVYSFAARRDVGADPGNTPKFASYFAVNLFWEPIKNTTMGIEYLHGTNQTKDDAFGAANRVQVSVQYNFP